jgi:hypothetical protein
MTRWVVLGCAVVVSAGVVYRLTATAGDDHDVERDAAPEAAVRTEAPAPETDTSGQAIVVEAPKEAQRTSSEPADKPPALLEIERRLLRDDTLAPPGASATAEEKTAYNRTVMAIVRGQDPLMDEMPASPAGADGPRPAMRTEAMQRRLAERRKAAVEVLRQRREERLKPHVERIRRLKEEHEARMMERDPNRPAPEPLFPPPKLGPAVVGVEEPAPAPAQE